MATRRKILISLPEELVAQMDDHAKRASENRSEFIRRVITQMLLLEHTIQMRDQMRKGYQQMATINREWAELGLAEDEMILSAYEKKLSECE